MTARMMFCVVLMQPLLLIAAEIAPELWDRPRSAQSVMASAAVRQTVAAYQQDSAVRIVIVHGSRPEAQAQAEELRAWLVALAIESSRVLLRADPDATAVSLEMMK